MWEALEQGKLLRAILEDFYGRVYEDARLARFFEHVTKGRAIDKQYEFLRDKLLGTRDYFGDRPRNAHHWMVISDELFDYREALLSTCARDAGLDERWVARLRAISERFRKQIVKDAPIPKKVRGRALPLEGYEDLVLSAGALCDACGEPIEVEGSGLVSARAFVLPGLTPSAAEATGVPVEALLAHAEAEHLLARAGWLGSDTVLEESVPRSALASRVMPSPPTPDAGCVPWVVVGLGVGDARTSWMGRQVDHDPTEGHFALGVIACAPGSLGSRITELRSHQGAGAATLYMRAFEPRQGPAVQEGPPLARVGELRLVSDAEELSEVRSVEDRGED